jgi:hypothetical protein
MAADSSRLAQILDHAPECGADGRLLQARQPAHHGHAGFNQGVHLAAEQLYVDRRDFLFAELLPCGEFPTYGRHRAGSRGNLDRRHARAEQLVGDRTRIGAFEHALHQFAAAVAALVRKERHVTPPAGY